MLNKLKSPISQFAFIAVLFAIVFIPNGSQNVFGDPVGGPPTIVTITTSSTTTMTITFNEHVNATLADVGGDFTFSTGGTITSTDITVLGNHTLVLTTDVPFGTGVVPTLNYTGTSLKDVDEINNLATFSNSTGLDGVAPVFSSAATASSTTIDVVFSESMTQGSVANGDFTIDGTIAAGTTTVTGISTAGSTVTLTLSNILVNTDTPTVEYTGDTDDLEDTSGNDLATFTAQTVTNNVSPSGGSHLGCAGDCTSPTIGLDKYQARMVDGGFSYNRNTVDVIDYHTPFPLISAQIGQTNTVTVKIFDEYGTQGIRLVQFGLGLPEIGSPLDNAEAIIAIWYEYGGNNIEEVTITDKHNLIENSSVKTQTKIVDCREGSADQCTQLTMKYMYREASIYNVIRVNVMDSSRNLQTSTFNDGVEVLGESMNPADITTTHVPNILYPQQRGLIELTNIDRGEKLWIDPYGYVWQGDDSKMVLLSTIPLKEQDNDPKSVWSGYNNRINSNFAMYKQEQIDKAQEIFDILWMDIQGDDLTDYVAETIYFTYTKKSNDRTSDTILQQALIDEANRAELVLEELLSKTHFANIHY